MIIYYHKMENLNKLINLESIVRNEAVLKDRLFTDIQFNILKKRLSNKALNVNERTYYYKFIKPKIKAMMAFFDIDEINIKGKEHMIKDRAKEAVKIIKKLELKHKNKKIIVSGSFLFNKTYNDIDAFVFTKYEKEDYNKGKLHVTFLPESALNSLFFSSLSQISVSNFAITPKDDFKIGLTDLLQNYELLINSMMNNEKHEKELRDFILQTEYYSKNIILNPKQLYIMKNQLFRKNSDVISNSFINSLTLAYNKETKIKLQQQIAGYKKLAKDYKSAKNLPTYINTYAKVIELAS